MRESVTNCGRRKGVNERCNQGTEVVVEKRSVLLNNVAFNHRAEKP